MRRAAGILIVVGFAASARARPRPVRAGELQSAARAAKAELDACARQAGASFGDVVVDATWTASASKSLGANGPAIAACTRDALKLHYQPSTHVGSGSAVMPSAPGGDRFTFRIGTPAQVLPSIAKFMPVWRAAIAPHATQADRAELAKLVPPDYAISGRCLVTDRAYARDLEDAWLDGLGVLTTWSGSIDELVARRWTRRAAWDGTGLVTSSSDGLCADAFDPVAARAVFDRAGSCWVGSPTDILLDPHIAFPNASYVQVATAGGRTCAVTAQGALTCCGRSDAKLGTAPTKPLRQIALGDDFSCGLDDAGIATCWGRVTTAPKGAFTKLVAGHYRACGIHRDGSVECWPGSPSPRGTFVDIALAWGACGVHTDGAIECWDRAPSIDPPSRWERVAIGDSKTLCGLRRDQSVGCTQAKPTDDGKPMSTVVPEPWTQIAVAEKFGACGIQRDGTIACSDLHPAWLAPRGTPPPAGTFTQLAADDSQFCAVGSTGAISCWGDPWPRSRAHPIAPPPTGVHGSIVDDGGAPIAHATIAIEETRLAPPTISTSAADGTWSSSTQQRTLWAKITAPGREVVDRYGDRAAFAAPIVLRPAATVTIEASCDGQPCSSMVQLGGYLHDPRLEHVAPGSYRLLVWSEHGFEGERLAVVELEMPFAAVPQTLHVALKETGSGHTLRGSVWTATKKSIEGQRVEVRCANEAYRRVETDARGNFELRNVPPLPCTLEASGIELVGNRVQLTSYANQRLELR